MGWIGLDAPVEIIDAAGYRPLRLDPDPATPPGPALAYAEGGGHPWIRAAVDRILREGAELEGVVIGSTPVLGVWLYNFLLALRSLEDAPPLPPIHLCNISHLDEPSARELSVSSLKTLAEALGASPAALEAAIAERNGIRRLQREVEARRFGPNPTVSGAQARRLLDAADVMTPGEYSELVGRTLAQADSPLPAGSVPVVLSGPGSPTLDLHEALERQGFQIVADDMDFGTRAIGPDVGPGEPLQALADRYAGRSPAPSGWSTSARIRWLLDLARERGAKGVLFDLPNWAHSAAWDFPKLEQALKGTGLGAWLLDGGSPAEAAALAAGVIRSTDEAASHG